MLARCTYFPHNLTIRVLEIRQSECSFCGTSWEVEHLHAVSTGTALMSEYGIKALYNSISRTSKVYATYNIFKNNHIFLLLKKEEKPPLFLQTNMHNIKSVSLQFLHKSMDLSHSRPFGKQRILKSSIYMQTHASGLENHALSH